MKRFALVLVTIVALASASAAPAAPTLYVVAEQAGQQQVPNPAQFNAIFGYPKQCVTGIVCYTYTKGTRSPIGTYPESWYLHVNGVRVMDKVYGFYVMDPTSPGWQQQVIANCTAHCFLDAMGKDSLNRDVPKPAMTGQEWLNAEVPLLKAVKAAGIAAMPNSISDPTLISISNRGSTESFTPATAQNLLGLGNVWVSERGDCLNKYNAFLKYKGRNDHFSCFELGHLPWDTSWLP